MPLKVCWYCQMRRDQNQVRTAGASWHWLSSMHSAGASRSGSKQARNCCPEKCWMLTLTVQATLTSLYRHTPLRSWCLNFFCQSVYTQSCWDTRSSLTLGESGRRIPSIPDPFSTPWAALWQKSICYSEVGGEVGIDYSLQMGMILTTIPLRRNNYLWRSPSP